MPRASGKTAPVFCGKDCGGDACPLLARIEGGRAVSVGPNPAAGPFLAGCPKGVRLAEEHYSPRRLRSPLLRTGPRGSGSFREAGWDEALSLAADRLGEIVSRRGAASVMDLSGGGSTGALHGTGALAARFLGLLGGGTSLSSNYSNGAAAFVLPYMLGADWRSSGFDPATMEKAGFIVLWGANILEARLGTGLAERLLRARERGARIVAIDPRRTPTVRRAATDWLPIRPGTDAALMLALLHVMFEEGLVDRRFVEARAVGFGRLERYVMGLDGEGAPPAPRSPEWAAPICGVAPAATRELARAWAGAKPAMLLPGYSIQRVAGGEETYRLALALQLATGSFGRLGGSTGSLNNKLPGPRVGRLPRQAPGGRSGPEVPVLLWPDAILGGRAGGFPSDIAAAYSIGGNMANQGAQAAKSLAALDSLEFLVCHEMFMTPTALRCDLVLPAASPLEKADIGIPWLGNYILYKPRVAASEGRARTDYDILAELSERMGFGPAFSEGKGEDDWIEAFLDTSEVGDREAFKRDGIHFGAEQERPGYAEFSADPAGHPLSTPSGKVEIESAAYAALPGGSAIPLWRGGGPAGGASGRQVLSLVTPKRADRVHSQGSAREARAEGGEEGLQIHPRDAAERGVGEGDLVLVRNEFGATRARARLSEDIMAGVVSLPEGTWLELGEDGVDLAGSANLLTSTEPRGPARAAVMHGIAVEVLRLDGGAAGAAGGA